mgnify:CR=1 FL=1
MEPDLDIPKFNCTKCTKFISFAQLYEDDLQDTDFGLCKHDLSNMHTVSHYRTCSNFDPE